MYLFVKRLADIIFSLGFIIVLLLPMAVISVLICIDSKGGPFFTQPRVGKDGRLFSVIKFRTMRAGTPSVATRDIDDPDGYITRVGRLLRKTSVDELPQFFNVLAGQMSIIGPRPVIAEERELNELRRKNGAQAVRPGMSGLAQVNGRDEMTVEEKAEFDGYYAEHIGLVLDVKIFAKTIVTVLTGRGYREGGACSAKNNG